MNAIYLGEKALLTEEGTLINVTNASRIKSTGNRTLTLINDNIELWLSSRDLQHIIADLVDYFDSYDINLPQY